MAHNTLVNGVLGEFELTACNFLANVIDDCHGMTLYLKHISPTQYSAVDASSFLAWHVLGTVLATAEQPLPSHRGPAPSAGHRELEARRQEKEWGALHGIGPFGVRRNLLLSRPPLFETDELEAMR